MMAFSQKYESTAAPRSKSNSVNSLLGVIFVSYKDSASAACVHPENSFNINLDVLENAEITSRESNLTKTQLGWAGHVF